MLVGTLITVSWALNLYSPEPVRAPVRVARGAGHVEGAGAAEADLCEAPLRRVQAPVAAPVVRAAPTPPAGGARAALRPQVRLAPACETFLTTQGGRGGSAVQNFYFLQIIWSDMLVRHRNVY